MENKIVNIFNKIFLCLKDLNLKSFEDLSNTKILYEIGLELDNKIFSSLEVSITGEDDLKTRISELNEISEAFLNILKSSEFIPTDKFKEEIELIDIIGLANKENNTIYNFSILILITVNYCQKKENLKLLNSDEQSILNNLINPYIVSQSEETEHQSDYKTKIDQLEKELKSEKERASKIKLFEEQYNSLKKKIASLESKNVSLLKELLECKNMIKTLEKTIEEKNNKMGILQAKLEEKNKLLKEKDIQLNKEMESTMDLKSKLEEINNNDKNNNKINIIENFEDNKKYKEALMTIDDLKIENNQLNEIIKVMELKIEEKKHDDKEKEELKSRYEKEFELMSSAIYNLGFQFWSLKLEDSEKLKQNENWLVRERIKQYNGDY
jgi:exonuclease SbcC